MQYLLLGCRCFVAVTFLLSVAGKARSRRTYADFVTSVRTLTPALPSRVVAPLVIAAEAIIALFLALPATVLYGFAAGGSLLAAFTFVLVLARRRGTSASCNCFGNSTEPIGVAHIARNAVLVAACAGGAVLALGTGGSMASDDPGAVVTALILGSGCAGLVLLTDEISYLFKTPSNR